MEILSQGVAKTLWEQVFKDVGLLKKVISDRGSQFVSNFIKGICVQLGIEQNPSMLGNHSKAITPQAR